jgi:aspartate/methionine/tyrosine aminotransferase
MELNRVSRTLETMVARQVPIADLTESNPTRVDLPYPAGLLSALAAEEALHYEPHPLGLLSARNAVAADHLRRGVEIDPAHIVLTASTSEAYSWLFKLLCNPGDTVLVPQPSYPLFEHLTALEGVQTHPYALEYYGRWSIDIASMAAAPAETRAVVIVSPNNPTGSYVTPAELEQIAALCRRRSWALVADEVFSDYPLEAADPITDIASRLDVLSFSLGGLSKSIGLPQLKLGWIVVGGAASPREAALKRLELIADTFLSVATPVQRAAQDLLGRGASVRAAIHQRVRQNLDVLRSAVGRFPACAVLRTEGGWSAVLRVPSTRREEQLVLDLLEREQILVHPGYFFEFPHEAHLVLSLLPRSQMFGDAVERLLRFVSC